MEKYTELELDEEMKNELLYSVIEKDLKELAENKESNKSKEKIVKKSKIKSKSKDKSHTSKNIKSFTTRLKENVKVKTLIVLLLTLIMNTYAWFVFIKTSYVNTLNTHIQSWSFEFSGDTMATLDVSRIYPGMVPAYTTIVGTNNGETNALLSYDLAYLKVLDDDEFLSDGGLITNTDFLTLNPNFSLTATNKAPGEILEYANANYPFLIEVYAKAGNDAIDFTNCETWTETDWASLSTYKIGTDTSIDMSTSNKMNISVVLRWPYETLDSDGNVEPGDVVDTAWGNKSYAYSVLHATDGEPCISLTIKLTAKQKN